MKDAVRYSLVAMLGAFIVGCGGGSSSSGSSGDDGGGSSSLASLGGRAAVGAPIAGATVSARCEGGNGFTSVVTTDSSGSFSGQVESMALPCALRVSGGSEATTLHSFAESAGTVNITPLTDMVIALSSSVAPGAWFEREDRSALVENLEVARRELVSALREASYELPADEFDPFSTPFTIGDAVDRVLDTLGEAIAALPTVDGYAAFVDLVTSGNLAAIPGAPAGGDEGPGGGGGGNGGGGLPGSGGGSAAACFNTLPSTPGTRLELRQRTFDPSSGAQLGVVTNSQDVGGQTTFRGETLRFVDIETVVEEAALNFTDNSRNYLSFDESALVVSSHGVETINPDDGSVVGTQWFEPTNDFQYDLNPGESFRQIYTAYQSTGGGPASVVQNVDVTVTYAGRETVTVPAGTFETCKFYIQDTGSRFSSASVIWRNVGDGIGVQTGFRDSSGSEAAVTEMLSYSINGVQQAP